MLKTSDRPRRLAANRRRPRLSRTLAGAAALIAVIAAPLTSIATAASAAEIPSAIKNVSVVGTPPHNVNDVYKVDADWAVPDGSHAGDTFSLDFPAVSTAYAGSFNLEDDSGAVVGSCDVTSSRFLCTLSDYVETHLNVHGTIHFTAKVTASPTDPELIYLSGGSKFVIALPGPIGPAGPGSAPSYTKLAKDGTSGSNGELTWYLQFPASVVVAADGSDIVLTDNYDSRLSPTTSVSVWYWHGGEPTAGGGWAAVPEGSGSGTSTVNNDPANHTFTVVVNDAKDYAPETSFQVIYQTMTPAGTADGTVFTNTVTGSGPPVTKNLTFISAGGTGGGTSPGGIAVSKVDAADASKSLAGAVFDVKDATGAKVGTVGPTDAAGKASVTGLTPGDYTLVETTAPAGYDLNTSPVSATVPSGGSDSVTITDALTTGGISVSKVDAADASKSLAGAVFDVKDATGAKVGTVGPTDAAGKASVTGLTPGDYTLVETTAPTGYDLNNTPVSAKVTGGQTGDVTVTDAKTPPATGGIAVHKVDKADASKSLAGAVFDVKDSTGAKVGTVGPTDAAGKASVTGLAPGSYTLVETTAPAGYDLNTSPVSATVPSGGSDSVTITDVLTTGGIAVSKVDAADASKSLAGAVFDVKDSTGAKVGTVGPTDAAGKASVTGLAPGSYTLVETTAPTGYDLNTSPVSATVPSGGSDSVTITDVLTTGGIAVSKVDAADASKSLAGAVFDVKDATGAKVGTVGPTDAAGKASVTGLTPGDYTLVETTAPTGYDLNTSPVSATVPSGGSDSVTITDALTTGGIAVSKVDAADASKSLAGAVFDVKDATGAKVGTVGPTDAAGKASVTGLVPGNYTLVETTAPTGYDLNTSPVSAKVTGGQTGDVTVTDAKTPPATGGLAVSKVDAADASKSLAGAVFDVKDATGATVGTVGPTDAAGKASVTGLVPGNYTLVETTAPAGYDLNTSPVSATVPSGGSDSVTITDALTTGGIGVHKVDKADNSKSLAGAVFDVKDATGAKVGTVGPTDAAGKASVTGLAPGSYTLVETTAPTGYDLNNTPVSAKVTGGQTGDVTVTDAKTPPATGGIAVHKVDKADASKSLAGAVFDVKDATGAKVGTVGPTDAAGKASVTGLVPGNYTLVETTAPTGYDLNTSPVSATVPSGGSDSVTITDALTTGGISVSKVDAADASKSLAGAVFDVKDATGAKVGTVGPTDAAGKASVTGLTPGDYTLVETTAPAGYDLNTSPVSAKVTGGQTGDVTVTDAKTPPATGGIAVSKVDAADASKSLAGAVFDVKDATGATVGTVGPTDAAGKASVTGLVPGNYTLVETTAPAGYDLNTSPVSATVPSGGSDSVTITDALTTGGIGVHKVDKADNSKSLAGAVFDVKDATGAKVGTVGPTDAAGKASVTGLVPGNYTLVETTAPTGYDLNTSPVSAKVTGGQTGDVTVTDAKTPPATGGIAVSKVDAADASKSLAGAVFDVKDSTGATVGQVGPTDAAGKASVTGLAPGNYTLVETTAPTGYDLNNTPIHATVTGGGTDQETVTDAKTPPATGGIAVSKVDAADASKSLAGAVFDVKDATGAKVGTVGPTDAAGKASVTGLTPGDYTLVETTAPAGYDLNTSPVSAKVTGGQTGDVTVTDAKTPPATGGIAVHKVDKADASKSLAGAVFDVKDSTGAKVGTVGPTDAAGKASVTGLTPGSYTLVETTAPAGYDLNTTPVSATVPSGGSDSVTITDALTTGGIAVSKVDAADASKSLAGAVFDVKDATGAKVGTVGPTDAAGKASVTGLVPGNYTLVETTAPTGYDLNTSPVSATVPSGGSDSVTITDALTTGGISVSKVDAADASKSLAGAVFDVKDSTGAKVGTVGPTDAAGKASVTGLTPGDYTLVETTAPAGYDLNTTPKSATVTGGGTDQETVTDVLTTGGIAVLKVDAADNSKSLAGAVFDVKDATGAKVGTVGPTDAAGNASVTGLVPGDYTLVETTAPTGYDLNTTPALATVTGGGTAQATVTDVLTTGAIAVSKVDAADASKVLAGAVFDVKDATGAKVGTVGPTDAAGNASVTGLVPGDYTLVETTAPTGYELKASPIAASAIGHQTSVVTVSDTATDTPVDPPKHPGPSVHTGGYTPIQGDGPATAGGAFAFLAGGVALLIVVIRRRDRSHS